MLFHPKVACRWFFQVLAPPRNHTGASRGASLPAGRGSQGFVAVPLPPGAGSGAVPRCMLTWGAHCMSPARTAA